MTKAGETSGAARRSVIYSRDLLQLAGLGWTDAQTSASDLKYQFMYYDAALGGDVVLNAVPERSPVLYAPAPQLPDAWVQQEVGPDAGVPGPGPTGAQEDGRRTWRFLSAQSPPPFFLPKRRRPPTTVGYRSAAVGYSPTAVGYSSTAVGYPPTAVGYSSTAVGYPLTAVCCPSSAV